MSVMSNELPNKIFLQDYGGDFKLYINAVYEVFKKDFIIHHPKFGGVRLGLKYHPEEDGRAYTFYHMTHSGNDESNRTPDIRRCECIPWGRPTIEKVVEYNLKFWEQVRNGKHRICIWLDVKDDVDYFFILDVRRGYVLPWTAFIAEYKNSVRKKEKEYNEWVATHPKMTPEDLLKSIMEQLENKSKSRP